MDAVEALKRIGWLPGELRVREGESTADRHRRWLRMVRDRALSMRRVYRLQFWQRPGTRGYIYDGDEIEQKKQEKWLSAK